MRHSSGAAHGCNTTAEIAVPSRERTCQGHADRDAHGVGRLRKAFEPAARGKDGGQRGWRAVGQLAREQRTHICAENTQAKLRTYLHSSCPPAHDVNVGRVAAVDSIDGSSCASGRGRAGQFGRPLSKRCLASRASPLGGERSNQTVACVWVFRGHTKFLLPTLHCCRQPTPATTHRRHQRALPSRRSRRQRWSKQQSVQRGEVQKKHCVDHTSSKH